MSGNRNKCLYQYINSKITGKTINDRLTKSVPGTLNAENFCGKTALYLAVEYQNLEAVQALLNLNAHAKLSDNEDEDGVSLSPLHRAIQLNNLGILEALCKYDPNLFFEKTREGNSAKQLGEKHGDYDMKKFITRFLAEHAELEKEHSARANKIAQEEKEAFERLSKKNKEREDTLNGEIMAVLSPYYTSESMNKNENSSWHTFYKNPLYDHHQHPLLREIFSFLKKPLGEGEDLAILYQDKRAKRSEEIAALAPNYNLLPDHLKFEMFLLNKLKVLYISEDIFERLRTVTPPCDPKLIKLFAKAILISLGVNPTSDDQEANNLAVNLSQKYGVTESMKGYYITGITVVKEAQAVLSSLDEKTIPVTKKNTSTSPSPSSSSRTSFPQANPLPFSKQLSSSTPSSSSNSSAPNSTPSLSSSIVRRGGPK